MTTKVLFGKVAIRLSVYLAVTFGFSYQSWKISDEYFKYPTITLVQLVDIPAITLPPKMALAFLRKKDIFPGSSIANVLDTIDDKTEILSSKIRTPNHTEIPNLNLERFLLDESYCISFSAETAFMYSPEDLYATKEPFYTIALKTNVLLRNTVAVAYLKPYHSDWEGTHKTGITIYCPELVGACHVHMTYSSKLTKLSPYPYDTNCVDYTQFGFTSGEQCMSLCLTNFTAGLGYILMSNYISVEKYRHSAFRLIPGILRSMRMGGTDITESLLKAHVDSAKLNNDEVSDIVHRLLKSVDNIHQYEMEKIIKRISAVFPSYLFHHSYCKRLCGRRDCHRESLTPYALTQKSNFDILKFNMALGLYVYPTNDLTIVVISEAKLHIIDMFVYLFSNVSFWFGFCPLSFANYVKLRKKDNPRANVHHRR